MTASMDKKQIIEKYLKKSKNLTHNSFFLEKSTVNQMVSHIKVLLYNNVKLNLEYFRENENHTELLKNLKSRRDDKPINPLYALQILKTLKHLFGSENIHVDSKYFNKFRKNPINRLMSPDFIKSVKKLVSQAAKTLDNEIENLKNNGSDIDDDDDDDKNDDQIFNLSFHDTALVILITTATCLRIEEIMQLNMKHLQDIKRDLKVAIKSKKTYKQRNIPRSEFLMLVIANIEKLREQAIKSAKKKIKFNANDSKMVEFKTKRLKEDKIILTSVSYLRDRLKIYSAMNEINFLTPTKTTTTTTSTAMMPIGFTVFRKLMTTYLVNEGGYILAQLLNNHKNLNTTMSNYVIATNEASENVLQNLMANIERDDYKYSSSKKKEEKEEEQQQLFTPPPLPAVTTTTFDYQFPPTPQATPSYSINYPTTTTTSSYFPPTPQATPAAYHQEQQQPFFTTTI